MSTEVRKSTRGFPGLNRSASVNAQQAAWMASRIMTQSRKDEFFDMVWRAVYKGEGRRRKEMFEYIYRTSNLVRYVKVSSVGREAVIHEVGVKCHVGIFPLGARFNLRHRVRRALARCPLSDPYLSVEKHDRRQNHHRSDLCLYTRPIQSINRRLVGEGRCKGLGGTGPWEASASLAAIYVT